MIYHFKKQGKINLGTLGVLFNEILIDKYINIWSFKIEIQLK